MVRSSSPPENLVARISRDNLLILANSPLFFNAITPDLVDGVKWTMTQATRDFGCSYWPDVVATEEWRVRGNIGQNFVYPMSFHKLI